MKILVIVTGGTIASSSGNSISLNTNERYTVVDKYMKLNPCVDFEIISPFFSLSENLDVSFLNQLIKTINDLDFNDYNGIIITHGTDTLCFSAAAIALLFGNSGIPIVFVSSNKPLDNHNSNGFENFCDAVIIINQMITGVFVTMFSGNHHNVHLGTSIMSADGFLDEFTAPFGNPYGYIENGLFIKNEKFSSYGCDCNKVISSSLNITNNVLFLPAIPFICLNNYNFSGVSAVLISLFHSGTADDKKYIPLIKELKNKSIDSYICSCKDGYIYETTTNLINAGAIPIYNTTLESSLLKLMIAYNQTDQPAINYMRSNIYFERLRPTE